MSTSPPIQILSKRTGCFRFFSHETRHPESLSGQVTTWSTRGTEMAWSVSPSTRGSSAYLDQHAERIKSRHVAKRRPHTWYRTIDKVDPSLQAKGQARTARHQGRVESRTRHRQPLPAPQSLLRGVRCLGSGSPGRASHVRCRQRHHRFIQREDAWRLLPLPGPVHTPNASPGARADSTAPLGEDLATAFRSRDRQAATELAARIYGIERSTLREALLS